MLFLLQISCSKSDSNPNIPKELIGKWQYVEFYGGNPDENGNYPQNLITNGYVVDYKSDGTFTSTEGEYNDIFYGINPLVGLDHGTFSVSSENIITMIYTNDVDTYTINKKLNFNSDFELIFDYNVPVILYDEGFAQKLNKITTVNQ